MNGDKSAQDGAQKPKSPDTLCGCVDGAWGDAAARHHGSVLQVRMREIHQKVHRDLPPTRMWGYNGTWPGPTIEVRTGKRFQ